MRPCSVRFRLPTHPVTRSLNSKNGTRSHIRHSNSFANDFGGQCLLWVFPLSADLVFHQAPYLLLGYGEVRLPVNWEGLNDGFCKSPTHVFLLTVTIWAYDDRIIETGPLLNTCLDPKKGFSSI